MKKRRTGFGIASLAIGALAVFASATATYARASHNPAGGVVLDWLKRVGLVHERGTGVPSITEASIFAVNDENALIFWAALAITLAIAAMLLALFAEWRQETTLFLSGGYVCGCMALAFFSLVVSFVSMLLGVVFVLVLRQYRKERALLGAPQRRR